MKRCKWCKRWFWFWQHDAFVGMHNKCGEEWMRETQRRIWEDDLNGYSL